MKNTALVTGVYDGDSITCDVVYPITDNSYMVQKNVKVRIYGIDTPEVRHKNPLHKAAGIRARVEVRSLLLNQEVDLLILKDHDKYGRMLAYVEIDGVDISKYLLENGYAQEYYGGTKKKWIF